MSTTQKKLSIKKMSQIIKTFKFYIKTLPSNSINREILEETATVIDELIIESRLKID